jgi:hypothetical protein
MRAAVVSEMSVSFVTVGRLHGSFQMCNQKADWLSASDCDHTCRHPSSIAAKTLHAGVDLESPGLQ